jgi:hypothetical protein
VCVAPSGPCRTYEHLHISRPPAEYRVTQDYFEGKGKGVWVSGGRAPYILILSTQQVDSNDKASDLYSGSVRFESLPKP